ncbi:MAG TPA: methyltransferase domain-containing protein [Candidatus Dormibacteraeota bacterium]|nr:methyltransferase domain-containing protein [Candidatus Dormibacteraeota bacterium]
MEVRNETPTSRPGGAWFRRPTGLRSRLAGLVLAAVDEAMNELAAELIDPRPHDAVLEIGFGPGRLIERLAQAGDAELVAGVDPSPAMLGQATKRNWRWIARGRVRLLQAGVSRLPFPDGSFTRACAVNTFPSWPSPLQDLREVRRVLRLGGRLVLCLRVRDPRRRLLAVPGMTEAEIETVPRLLEEAGFRDLHIERRSVGMALIAHR